MRMRTNMAQGGYKQPSNPAPVGLPGALSQRTDGGAIEGMTQPAQTYTGMPYKQNGLINNQQTQADLSGNPFAQNQIIQLDAPDSNPHIPIEEGIKGGLGKGTEAMRGLVPNAVPSIFDTLQHVAQFDYSGDSELILRSIMDNG